MVMASHGTTAMRLWSARARDSFNRSFVPMTRQARRLAGSAPSAAISRAFSTELGVSIIAQSRVFAGAPMEPSTLATVTMSPGCATFGTRIASGATLAAARRSSMPQAVSMALGRITSSRRP